MVDLNGFDANSEEPVSMDFDAVPAGDYEVMISESERVENSSGNGWHLKLTLTILDGQYKGRLLWHRLNLDNPNAQAVQISRGQLSAICRAVGVLTPKDSSQLHNLPMVAKVSVREYEGKTYNDVKSFKPVKGEEAPAADSAAPKKPAPQKGAAPWAKSKTG